MQQNKFQSNICHSFLSFERYILLSDRNDIYVFPYSVDLGPELKNELPLKKIFMRVPQSQIFKNFLCS